MLELRLKSFTVQLFTDCCHSITLLFIFKAYCVLNASTNFSDKLYYLNSTTWGGKKDAEREAIKANGGPRLSAAVSGTVHVWEEINFLRLWGITGSEGFRCVSCISSGPPFYGALLQSNKSEWACCRWQLILRVAFCFYVVIIACAFILEGNVNCSLVFLPSWFCGCYAIGFLIQSFSSFCNFIREQFSSYWSWRTLRPLPDTVWITYQTVTLLCPTAFKPWRRVRLVQPTQGGDDLPFNSVISISPAW